MHQISKESVSDVNKQTPEGKIFIADKPLNYTSANVVRIFKKKLKLKKVGHAGTLDPRATGLLILCSDKMTKKLGEFMDYEKEYEGIIRLGATTKSFDTETDEENVLDDVNVSDEDIQKTKLTFLGESEQMPPMYSAIKHKGKPLYKIARKGREIERQPRKIHIKEFEIKKTDERELLFRITVSKGTYIRVIADDFGRRLGTGGYLKELKRTRIGNFELKDLNETVDGIHYAICKG